MKTERRRNGRPRTFSGGAFAPLLRRSVITLARFVIFLLHRDALERAPPVYPAQGAEVHRDRTVIIVCIGVDSMKGYVIFRGRIL